MLTSLPLKILTLMLLNVRMYIENIKICNDKIFHNPLEKAITIIWQSKTIMSSLITIIVILLNKLGTPIIMIAYIPKN